MYQQIKTHSTLDKFSEGRRLMHLSFSLHQYITNIDSPIKNSRRSRRGYFGHGHGDGVFIFYLSSSYDVDGSKGSPFSFTSTGRTKTRNPRYTQYIHTYMHKCIRTYAPMFCFSSTGLSSAAFRESAVEFQCCSLRSGFFWFFCDEHPATLGLHFGRRMAYCCPGWIASIMGLPRLRSILAKYDYYYVVNK